MSPLRPDAAAGGCGIAASRRPLVRRRRLRRRRSASAVPRLRLPQLSCVRLLQSRRPASLATNGLVRRPLDMAWGVCRGGDAETGDSLLELGAQAGLTTARSAETAAFRVRATPSAQKSAGSDESQQIPVDRFLGINILRPTPERSAAAALVSTTRTRRILRRNSHPDHITAITQTFGRRSSHRHASVGARFTLA